MPVLIVALSAVVGVFGFVLTVRSRHLGDLLVGSLAMIYAAFMLALHWKGGL